MPGRPPSFRAIAAFESAARHASFAKAAEELHLTRSAISHAIAELERRLGERLFERRGRGVGLTAAGRRFAANVRLSLRLLEDAMQVQPGGDRHRLVVATTASIARKILLPNLPLLQQACPQVGFDIRCSDALADLETDADLAIRFGPGTWSGMQSRLLAEEHLFPVASPNYPRPLPRTEAQLAEHELIHCSDSSWRLWLDADSEDLHEGSAALRLDDAAMALDAAVAGLGIALARGVLAEGDLKSGRLVRILDKQRPAEYSYWAVWSGGSQKHALIAGVVDAVARVFAARQNG
jgi:LysR family glycine cleavage system transcriptional activator